MILHGFFKAIGIRRNTGLQLKEAVGVPVDLIFRCGR